MSAGTAASTEGEGRSALLTRLGDLLARAGLDLAYLTIGLATSVLAFVVWVTAVSLTLSLLVFVVGLPVFLLSALALRWTTELDRRNATLVLGRPLCGRYRDHQGERFIVRLSSTAGDLQTWKDLAWLVVHSALGFVLGCVAIVAVSVTMGFALLPAWYWAIANGVDLGIWHVDSLGRAWAVALIAIPLAVISVALLRGMALAEVRLAEAVLGSSPATVEDARQSLAPLARSARRTDSRPTLAAHAALSGLLALLVAVIWLVTSPGYFWPAWVWVGLAIPLALHAGIREALRVPEKRRALAGQGALSAVLAGTVILAWALAGGGTFWPIWVLLGLAVALAIHGLAALMWRRVFPVAREQELVDRVDVLTRTRRGALDVQAAELRRIERDLHDGAQARLVALSMQLGRAEEDLADRPEAAELVRQARSEAGAAIAELRDLARGIAPPVLVDRGLAAAVEALGRRSAIPVSIDAELDRRPPPVTEAAAYFVVAESLTNIAKHAPDAAARVTIALSDDVLTVSVADDGPGGADPAGSGLGGLRQRVEALDGETRVTSDAEAGTTIEVELPCA